MRVQIVSTTIWTMPVTRDELGPSNYTEADPVVIRTREGGRRPIKCPIGCVMDPLVTMRRSCDLFMCLLWSFFMSRVPMPRGLPCMSNRRWKLTMKMSCEHLT